MVFQCNRESCYEISYADNVTNRMADLKNSAGHCEITVTLDFIFRLREMPFVLALKLFERNELQSSHYFHVGSCLGQIELKSFPVSTAGVLEV